MMMMMITKDRIWRQPIRYASMHGISSKASGKLSAGSRITSASHCIFRDVVLVYLLLKITGLLTLTTYNSTTVSRRFKLTVKLKWEVIPRLVLSVWCSVDRKCPEWRLTARDFAVRYRGCSYPHSRPVTVRWTGKTWPTVLRKAVV